MKQKRKTTQYAMAFLVFGLIAYPTISAQLPMLNKPPFTGYFAGIEIKTLRFGLDSSGGAMLSPQNNREKIARKEDSIGISFVLETTQADGTIQRKSFIPTTLETTQPATEKLSKVSFRGKFDQEAMGEVLVEYSRGVITLGGRLIDAGKLKDQSPRFAIHFKMPKFDPEKIKPPGSYSKGKENEQNKDSGEKRKSRSEERKEKEMAGVVTLEKPGGKPIELDFHEQHDLTTKELNGEGNSVIQVQMGLYLSKGIQFTAGPNSTLSLWNKEPTRLADGYTIRWVPDAHKDPKGLANLQIRVR